MELNDSPPEVNNILTQKSPKNNKKKNKKNKNKDKAELPIPAQSEQPDFDYSNVDFKKFGGGSIVEQNNEIKVKFHGKVNFYIQL